MRRRLLLSHLACLVLAGGGGAGHRLTSSGDDGPPIRQVTAAPGSSLTAVSPSDGTLLGRTLDASGQPHDLVLHTPGLREPLQRNELFAVLSGGPAYSITGDAVAGDWRFVVERAATEPVEPLVVLKFVHGTVADLAKEPSRFAHPAELTGDVRAASARLRTLVDSVLARAGRADGQEYRQLAAALTDPGWTGVLVLDASVPAIPGSVLGRPTGTVAGAEVPVLAMGFTVSHVTDPQLPARTPEPFFAIIDHRWAAGEDGSPEARQLGASFANGALTSFQLEQD